MTDSTGRILQHMQNLQQMKDMKLNNEKSLYIVKHKAGN